MMSNKRYIFQWHLPEPVAAPTLLTNATPNLLCAKTIPWVKIVLHLTLIWQVSLFWIEIVFRNSNSPKKCSKEDKMGCESYVDQRDRFGSARRSSRGQSVLLRKLVTDRNSDMAEDFVDHFQKRLED